MVYLTLDGLRDALEFIHNNPRNIKFHTTGDRAGLMINPDGFTDEQAYHLRIAQVLTPKLVIRLAEDYTALTLDGQELLDVLNDEPYLQAIAEKIKSLGFTAVSDRQVFRYMKDEMSRMTADQGVLLPQVFDIFFDAAVAARDRRPTLASTPANIQVAEEAIGQDAIENDEFVSTASDIISDVKKKKRTA